ncbi:hypothetical protein [Paraburkholderia agricolaris]
MGVGGVSIGRSKNKAGTDHRSLFQDGDRARLARHLAEVA